MSELFIQNQERISNITTHYFQNNARKMEVKSVKREHESDSEYEVSEFNLDIEDEKTSEIDDIEKSYHFLDTNEGELELLFDICDNDTDITKHYTIYLCGYNLNVSGHVPFFLYMMQLNNNGGYELPKIGFRCPTNIKVAEDDEDGKTPKHVYFENECTKHILELFELNKEITEEHMKNIFKGYVKSRHLENTIYVLFDMSRFSINTRDDVRRSWATVDEIVNLKQIFGYKIAQEATNLFYEKPELMQVKNEHGAILDTPPVLYLCRNNGEQYENIYSEYDERNRETSPYFSLIDERSKHPVLGNFFIFSAIPLDYHNESIMRIRRFVGFLENPLYFMSNIRKLSESDSDNMSLGKVIPSIVSYINEPNKKEITDEEVIRENNTEDVQDSDQINQQDREIDDLQRQKFGCAYFQDMLGETKYGFWCIKSEENFLEL